MFLKNKNIVIKKINAAHESNSINDFKPSALKVINKSDNKVKFDEFEIHVPYSAEARQYANHSLSIQMVVR